MGKDVDHADSAKSATPAPSARFASKSHKRGDLNLAHRGNPSPTREQPPSCGPQTFEFVLVTDEGSRRQVRRHAMRQYMRQRRLDGIARLGSSRIPPPPWSSRTTSVSSDESLSRVEELDDGNEQNLKVSSKHDRGIETSHRCFQPTPSQNIRRGSTVSSRDVDRTPSDPLAYPGVGGMVDPFNSYPVTVSPEERKLINHYVVTYPSMMYKMTGATHGNPVMAMFREFALQDQVPFQAMLAIASKHLAGVKGKTDTVESLTHKTRALSLIKERIRADSGGLREGTIYATATMAVIEKWSKDPSIEQMHFKGLAFMIKQRGGMRGLRASHHFLEKVLYWVDFSCAPKAIVGASLPWTGAKPDTLPQRLQFLSPDMGLAVPFSARTGGSEYIAEHLRACEDFLTFFRCLHEAERAILRAPFNAPSSVVSNRFNLFNASTPLYSVLTTVPDYDHGIRDVRFIDEYTCMACLLYLNVGLYECYLQSDSFDRYLQWLTLEIKRINPYSVPSISAVLWVLMDNGGFPSNETGDEGERSWFVSRMLRVAKRLEWKHRGALWDRLRDILIGFITTQQECGLGADNSGRDELFARQRRLNQSDDYIWNEDLMRREILENFYNGPPVYTPNPRIYNPGVVQA